jgi:hypothetical protein
MQSLKEFLGSSENHRDAQLLADITTDISNFRLNAKFKFLDNFKMKIDEDSTYKMSLYVDELSEKALGLNWANDEIASISYWSDYSASPQQPTKNILFNETLTLKNIKPILNAVYERLLSCKEDKKLLENVEFTDGDLLTEAEDDDDEFADIFAKLDFTGITAKDKAEKEEKTEKSASTPKTAAKTTPASRTATAKVNDDGDIIGSNYADPKYVFQDLEDSVRQLCRGGALNGVLIAGPGGTGKSYHVEKAFEAEGLQPGKDWVKFKVRMTPPEIYKTLLNNYDKIIVFDDCDEALTNKTAANIFKSAIDTYEHRTVSWFKTDTLNTQGLPNEVIKGLVNNDAKHRLPSTFEFTGACIFITNLPLYKIDSALLTRCDVIDVTLRRNDIGEIIRNQLSNIEIPVHQRATGKTINIGTNEELKREVLEFLLSDEYKKHMIAHNMPLNFRLFKLAYTYAYNNPESWKRRMFSVIH